MQLTTLNKNGSDFFRWTFLKILQESKCTHNWIYFSTSNLGTNWYWQVVQTDRPKTDLAGETVLLATDRTVEEVFKIVVDTPSSTVGTLAVVWVGSLWFGLVETTLEIFVVSLLWDKLGNVDGCCYQSYSTLQYSYYKNLLFVRQWVCLMKITEHEYFFYYDCDWIHSPIMNVQWYASICLLLF